jgi:putative FmdB family regulatory protein
MPTYEYRCPQGHDFELFQRMSEEPTAKCPECGKKSNRLLSGGAGLVFKGSGFYITDYRSDSYKEAAKSEQKDGAAAKNGSSGKTSSSGTEASGSKASGKDSSSDSSGGSTSSGSSASGD